jgi:hypothetical protein
MATGGAGGDRETNVARQGGLADSAERPASVVPTEAAKIPLTDFRSVRFHSRSLAFLAQSQISNVLESGCKTGNKRCRQ